MGDEYSDQRCRKCDEDMFQHSGKWLCPDCDAVDGFTLDKSDSESFTL